MLIIRNFKAEKFFFNKSLTQIALINQMLTEIISSSPYNVKKNEILNIFSPIYQLILKN